MMRRFEYVQGTSAKFWATAVEGSTFIVVFGRLGTEGQRKEKPFPTAEAARREMEKKVAEKLREGYKEVDSAEAAPAAASPAKKAAAAPAPRAPLPPRVVAVPLVALRVQQAAGALRELDKTVAGKHRSWRVAHQAAKARRALEGIAGADPQADTALAQAFDALMARVVAPAGRRLPLRLAMTLLLELDTAAFQRALSLWQKAPLPAVNLMTSELSALADAELTLRLFALLTARPDRESSPEAAWTRRWLALRPHLEAHLAASGSTLKAHLQAIDTSGDAALASRVQGLR
jgi:predicted DNA-binding WGR domain protein